MGSKLLPLVLLLLAPACDVALADAQHDAYDKFQRGERLNDADVDALAGRKSAGPDSPGWVCPVCTVVLLLFLVVPMLDAAQRGRKLTECPDCRRSVSRQAAICPKCGAPIRNEPPPLNGGSRAC